MSEHSRMYVIKRNGEKEPFYFDQITMRNEKLCEDLGVDPTLISQKVINNLYTGIKTSDIDILSAETALYISVYEPKYEILAKRIAISNLHKITEKSFSKVTSKLYELGILDETYYTFICNNSDTLDNIPQYERDYEFSYFGLKTLEKAYLIKDINKTIIERPQHLLMRVATYLRMPDIIGIRDVYELLSKKYFIHASPGLFNSGKNHSQLSSCFIVSMNDDLNDMLTCLRNAGMLSKWAGGLGVNISMIRSRGSRIKSTGGDSSGIVPFMKLWNDMVRYVNQGGNRKGAAVLFLETHHPDIYDFLNTRKNNTKDEERCLDINIGLWISDLFMKRVKNDELWSLIDSVTVPNLHTEYGTNYENIYLEAEKQKLYVRQVKARDLWKEILKSQMETGEPYMMFKDTINRKSNQKNRGVIRGSNLCCEIVNYSDNENYSVCNLASISLPAFVKTERKQNNWKVYSIDNCDYCSKVISILEKNEEKIEIIKCVKSDIRNINIPPTHTTFPVIFLNGCFIGGYTELIETYINNRNIYEFDFVKLGQVVETITENLNIVIDKNYYPVEQTKISNLEMRPIGIGIQGLADLLQMMNLSWENEIAFELNKNIYAVVYYHALKKSMELSKKYGPYNAFPNSPTSQGILQYDMDNIESPTTVNGLLDWKWLKEQIIKYGLRNSLVTAQMPTASTGQILGNNESFEPYTSNLYIRRVMAGDFPIINKHLYSIIKSLNLWTENFVTDLIINDGSVQNLSYIPSSIKSIFKTAWEIPTQLMINYAIARGSYIDQSQSFNVFMGEPDMSKLSSMFMYEWEKGIKTGMYYLRRKPKVEAIKFSIMKEFVKTKNTDTDSDSNTPCMNCSA